MSYNLRTPAGRNALDNDVFSALQETTKRAPISMAEIQDTIDCHQTAIRTSLDRLIAEGSADKTGVAVATRYHKTRRARPRSAR